MEEVDKALGGLNIIERGKSDGAALHTPSKPATPAPAASTATVKTVPSRTAYTVDVPNTVGTRFTPTSAAPPAQDEEDEMDAREREMGRILRFASLATGSRPGPGTPRCESISPPPPPPPHPQLRTTNQSIHPTIPARQQNVLKSPESWTKPSLYATTSANRGS